MNQNLPRSNRKSKDCQPTSNGKLDRGLAPWKAVDVPRVWARLYIRERCQHGQLQTLRFWREEWHRWDGTAYRVLPQKELRAELTTSVKAEMDRKNIDAQKHAQKLA